MTTPSPQSAAFYAAPDSDPTAAAIIAYIPHYGSPAHLGGWPLCRAPSDYTYTLLKFKAQVIRLTESISGVHIVDTGHIPPDQLPGEPLWQYVWLKGAVHVFHEGWQMATMWPHGARKRTILPGVTDD